MSCDARYATAYDFAGMMCKGSYLHGHDDSGGAANVMLTDNSAPNLSFVTFGVRAGVGQVLYNLTAVTSGPITAVTDTTITATGVTWDDDDEYVMVTLDAHQIDSVELNLDLAANDIHVALAASGACDCTPSAWGLQFLNRLNIIIAAAFYGCTCGKPAVIAGELREQYMTWSQTQLDMLRDGRLEVCQGETGSDFPALAWAERTLTRFSTEEILRNEILRRRS